MTRIQRLAPTLALGLALALPAAAQDGMRDGDRLYDAGALSDLLSGRAIEFFDGSVSRFHASGRYGYTYTDDGPVWAGVWRVTDNSEACVAFDNGSSRCDLIVADANRHVLITADGTRFPIRGFSDAEQPD